MSSTISAIDLLLIAGQLERQHAARRLADLVGDRRPIAACARHRIAAAAAPARAETGRTPRRSAAAAPAIRNALSVVDRRAGRRKVHVDQRRAAIDRAAVARARPPAADPAIVAGSCDQRLMHDHALHLRRQRPGLLVDRDDAAGVQRFIVGLGLRPLGVRPPAFRISYCGFCICMPCDVSSSLPNRMTRWCGWKTSLRNGWLKKTARSAPVRSRTSISKILKRGRRVGRMPQLRSLRRRPTRPRRAAATRWSEMCRDPRSGSGKRSSRSSTVASPTRWRSAARRGPTPFRY